MSNTKKSQQSARTRGANKTKTKPSKNNRNQLKLVTPGKLAAAPTATGRVNTTRKPAIRSKPNGDCLIRHREYIQEITAGAGSPATSFKVESLPINPGMLATFPWLSRIATRFEKYQFKHLKFLFETEAPTALGGSLMLGVDYDASDLAPSTKVQVMAYENSVRSPPWQECTHSSRQLDLSNQKGYYVRDSALPANQDIKLYDTGNLFVCSQNVATANSLLGELYVEYEVLLMTPQIGSDVQLASSLSGTAGSAVSIVTTGQIISGNMIISQVANLVSLQNLIVGNEYYLAVNAQTITAGAINIGSPIGLIPSTSLDLGSGVQLAGTFVASATSGSVELAAGGDITNVVFVIVPIPTLAF